jgi:hypothetical protein
VLGRAAPWTIQREIRKARAKINGLPEGFRFHDLRHYYASLLIASGADVKVVQHRLRHASAKTTLTPTGTSGRTATSRRGPLSNRRCRALLRNTEEPRTLALTFCRFGELIRLLQVVRREDRGDEQYGLNDDSGPVSRRGLLGVHRGAARPSGRADPTVLPLSLGAVERI